MSQHVYNNDGTHRRITWSRHGGFAIKVDNDRTYDNWRHRDDAPRVRLNLANDLAHLQTQDFVIQARTSLSRRHGDHFQAGIYIAFGPNNLVVFGPHGEKRPRLHEPNLPSAQGSCNQAKCYLKLKRRGNEYTAWESEDGEIWRTVGTVNVNAVPTDVGAILKTWGEPREETVAFAHFDITHVENVLPRYNVNDASYKTVANAIHFIYDLSGIDIPVNVYIRDADGNPSNDFDRKMYVIHGSFDRIDWPMEGYRIESFHNDIQGCNTGATPPTNALCTTDVLIISPGFNYYENHPIFGQRMQYRDLDGEEDWILIDLHENFIRERFPASTFSGDDRFFLVGSSAGGQFVNKLILTHPRKLEAAIARAPGRLTFPLRHDARYADLIWSHTTGIASTHTKRHNPRLKIDFDDVRNLHFAAVSGNNDNDLYFGAALNQPGVSSHVDGVKKWIRQLERRTGGFTIWSHISSTGRGSRFRKGIPCAHL